MFTYLQKNVGQSRNITFECLLRQFIGMVTLLWHVIKENIFDVPYV